MAFVELAWLLGRRAGSLMLIWQALSALAMAHGRRLSWRDLARHSAQVPEEITPEVAVLTLRQHGVFAQVRSMKSKAIFSARNLPVALKLPSEDWVLITRVMDDQIEVRSVQSSGELEAPEIWARDRVDGVSDGLLVEVFSDVPIGATDTPNHADALSARSHQPHWFWRVFSLLKAHYGDSVISAILINVLALAGSMFSMNVYDRVIPNAAFNSLWTLAIGVGIASLLELGLRILRAYLMDDAGKRADLALSAVLMQRTLNLRPEDRPASSGQWASQLREFESVREFVSSSTLVALTDLPFGLLFLVVIAWMGGSLVWVVVAAGVLIVTVGALTQLPIRRSIEQYQYENTQKHAFLIESLERLETIEALGAESAMQGRWERVCASAARSAMVTRMASALTTNTAQTIQQMTNVVLIVAGVYLITQGQLTVGALIGCSILASRALAPLSQVAGLLARWQHTKQAFSAVDRLMSLPVRADPSSTYVQWPSGVDAQTQSLGLTLSDVRFNYPRSESAVLKIDNLQFLPGETVAVTGAVGSGKSTLLRVLAGLQTPTQGMMLLGGLSTNQISPAEWRAHVAWVGQDCVLFRGSLRENLLIAAPSVSDERLIQVLRLCGMDKLISGHPMGLDMPVGESGQALSGGQRQWVALARALLADAKILLLDEPTSAMDMPGEQRLLEGLKAEFEGRLVVIATHRPGPLMLANRMIVLDAGQVVADGARDDVLRALQHGQITRAKVQSEEQRRVA